MTLARHSFDNFFGHGRVVFAALEAFVQQLNSKIGDLLSRPLGNLPFDC
jgi:hypothetical protein